ncbi:MAG: hypothetical protein MI924_22140 [Chloroflexales bacterium]|nr:hypothetical protein [Chloroflexales bacterium]
MELKRISRAEFEETVLVEVCVDLNVTFSPRVERSIADFTERAWTYTQGHWDNIALFATYLDDELPEPHGTYRVMTPEVIEPVFQRLYGAAYQPGDDHASRNADRRKR